jgi:hypothetical protein
MTKITVNTNQNLFDIALQYYGDIEMIWQLIDDNNLTDGIDTVLTPGQELLIDEEKIVNKELSEYLKQKGIATEIQ